MTHEENVQGEPLVLGVTVHTVRDTLTESLKGTEETTSTSVGADVAAKGTKEPVLVVSTALYVVCDLQGKTGTSSRQLA